MRSAFVVDNVQSTALRPLNYASRFKRAKPSGEAIQHSRLGSLVGCLGAGYKRIFTNVDAAPEFGIEILSQSDMFAAEPAGRHVRPDCIPRSENHRIKRWQILLAGAGTLGETELYGRPIIADARLEGKHVAYHALDLAFGEPGGDLNLYVYGFLLSKMGLRAVRSTSYGTKILSLRTDLVADIQVPLPDEATIARVARLVRRCVEQRETYARELQAARRVLEELPEMREAHVMCAERRARHVVWSDPLPTMNAWNYASTGGALDLLLRRWSGRLRDVVPGNKIFRGGRYQRVSCEAPSGIDFLNQRDVFSIRPVPRRIVQPNVDPDSVYVPPYSLLVGGQGTLGEGELFGQVALVTPDLAKGGITEHLLRIQPTERAHRAICYAFLSTLVGRRLLRSTGAGTKLLSLREDLVLSLPYPELDPKQAQQIQGHLDVASAARVEATNAESEAVRIIEEEVLPAWLA